MPRDRSVDKATGSAPGEGRPATAGALAIEDGSPSTRPSPDDGPPMADRPEDDDEGRLTVADARAGDGRLTRSEGATSATTALGGRGGAKSQAGGGAPAAGGALGSPPVVTCEACEDGAPPSPGGGVQVGGAGAAAAPPRARCAARARLLIIERDAPIIGMRHEGGRGE